MRRTPLLTLRALTTLTLVTAATPGAAAARATAKLSYEALDPACPSEETLRAAVAARLGYDPFATNESTSGAIVTAIRRDSTGLVAQITRTDAGGAVLGARALTSAAFDCVELVASAAVTISILLDPRAFVGLPPPPPRDRHETPPPSAPIVPEVEAPAAPAPPTTEPLVHRLGLGVLASTGTAPAPAIGFEAWADIERGPWSVALGARADLPASAQLADNTGVRASMLVATLAGCRRASIFGACALVLGGALFGEGSGAGAPDRATGPFFAAGPRGEVDFPLLDHRALLRAHLDAVAPLTRATFRVRGEPAWTSPPVAVTLGIGAAAQFP